MVICRKIAQSEIVSICTVGYLSIISSLNKRYDTDSSVLR